MACPEAETALLEAVKRRLQDGIGGLPAESCRIELDDDAPAIAGQEFFSVQPNSLAPGPHNATSGAIDAAMGVRVAILRRASNVPRDRRREVFLHHLKGITARLAIVVELLEHDYTLLELVNATLEAAEDNGTAEFSRAATGRFYEPFTSWAIEKPTEFAADVYDGAGGTAGGDPIVGIKRAVTLSGARFLQERAIYDV